MGLNFSGSSSSKAFSVFLLWVSTQQMRLSCDYFHVCFPEKWPFSPSIFLLISLPVLSRKNPSACLHFERGILPLSFQKCGVSSLKSDPSRGLPGWALPTAPPWILLRFDSGCINDIKCYKCPFLPSRKSCHLQSTLFVGGCRVKIESIFWRCVSL